jgi:AcrR family transcriptional regulator
MAGCKENEKMTPVSDDKAGAILEAVRTLLAKNGYAATTISLVASEAGVSRGLLHYYFKNKEEMLAQVLKTNMQASVALVRDVFARARSAGDLSQQLSGALRGIFQADPAIFHLFFEGWAVARQSPTVNAELKSIYREFRKAVHEGLETANQRGVIAPSIPLVGLATILTGIIDGISLQLVNEPALAEDGALWEAVDQAMCDLLGGT